MKTTSTARPKTSPTFWLYTVRLFGRAVIFLCMLVLYIHDRSILAGFVAPGFMSTFGLREGIWCLLMAGMILHLLPKSFITMAGRKSRPKTYCMPTEKYDPDELFRFVQIMNAKAWQVMLIWLCGNACFAAVYLAGIIGEAEMVLLTFFYFLCDLVCMMIFCPFQTFHMKNRCCVNCRIFDWGHFMMYTPMLFVKSFFSWSLFFTACIVLIRWEIVYALHPERFWHGSNAALRCENCRDRLCCVKHPLREMYFHIRKLPLPGFDGEDEKTQADSEGE